MQSFFSFLLKKKFPRSDTRTDVFAGPLTILKLAFYVFFAAAILMLYLLFIHLNDRFLVEMPAHGGRITEGVIGAPRFLNPVLAATDTEVALTSLIHAGLMREHGDGSLAPLLAERYEVSPDGRIYTFTLKEKLFFHDGSPLTTADVAYTIEKLRDPLFNPANANFWQMTGTEVKDPRTIMFILPSPYDGFLQRLTVGVISKAYWESLTPEAFNDPHYGLSPIGAGAFKVADVAVDGNGTPTSITLKRFARFAQGRPLLSSLVIRIFSNEATLLDAVQAGDIDLTFSLSSETLGVDTLPDGNIVTAIPTGRSVGLWRLSSESTLSNASFLSALNHSIDKASILATVENGYGIPDERSSGNDAPLTPENALATFGKLGYALQGGTLTAKSGAPIAIPIATKSDPKLIAIGVALAQELESFGIATAVQPFDPGTYQDELSGTVFPFLLSDGVGAIPSAYVQAIPLYTSATIAVEKEGDIYGVAQEKLKNPSLRYANVERWHHRTDRVYPLLKKLLTTTDTQ